VPDRAPDVAVDSPEDCMRVVRHDRERVDRIRKFLEAHSEDPCLFTGESHWIVLKHALHFAF